MVERARFRDRLYFCADETAAKELGVSRRTIIRARARLESAGRIVRERRRLGRAVVYSFPPNRRRKPRVTQRSSLRSGRKTYTPRYARGAAPRVFLMEIEPRGDKVTAADIVGAMVDTMAVHNVPVTSRAKAIIGKQAKDLLTDGFAPETVLAASVIALRRGEPHVAHFIAQDMVLARAGQKLNRGDYERELRAAVAALHPSTQRINAVLDKLDERKRR